MQKPRMTKNHDCRDAANDRRVAVAEQPDGRHRGIGIREKRKFPEVIHHHPKCKHKSQRIQDRIMLRLTVGA